MSENSINSQKEKEKHHLNLKYFKILKKDSLTE